MSAFTFSNCLLRHRPGANVSAKGKGKQAPLSDASFDSIASYSLDTNMENALDAIKSAAGLFGPQVPVNDTKNGSLFTPPGGLYPDSPFEVLPEAQSCEEFPGLPGMSHS